MTAVDGGHNGAAITHSLGLSSGVVTPGLGFLHNSHMEMFDPVAGSRNEIAPGSDRLREAARCSSSAMGGSRWIGSPAGARKVTAIVQAFLNIVDFDMSIEEAVSVERIHVENEPRTIIVDPDFPPKTLLELAALGQEVRFEWTPGALPALLFATVSFVVAAILVATVGS